MPQRSRNPPSADNCTAVTVHNRAGKRRLALQLLLDSIPGQIDVIREKKENDAIELRRFALQRERKNKRVLIKYSEMTWTGSSSGRLD